MAEKWLDCGEFGAPAAICQYGDCDREMCERCVVRCASCRKVICPLHQYWFDSGRYVYCPDDRGEYLARRIGRALAPSKDHAE